jgi:hypothetical protein
MNGYIRNAKHVSPDEPPSSWQITFGFKRNLRTVVFSRSFNSSHPFEFSVADFEHNCCDGFEILGELQRFGRTISVLFLRKQVIRGTVCRASQCLSVSAVKNNDENCGS